MGRAKSHSLCVLFFAVGVLFQMPTLLAADADDNAKFLGTVFFMRHALAPGVGDPENFAISDCRTQRNLSHIGREQARSMGKKLAEAQLNFSSIYSSYWCRCLETARLLKLGTVTPFDGLNSFYQGHVPRDATLQLLRRKLDSLPHKGPATLMITHYVTIQALTGLTVSSGGIVIYDLKTDTARELKLSSL